MGTRFQIFLKTFAEIVLWNGKVTRVCNRRGRMQGFTYSRVERNWWHYLDDEMYLTLSERKVARASRHWWKVWAVDRDKSLWQTKRFLSPMYGGRAGKLVNLTTGKEYKTRFLVLQIQYENLIMESSFLWQPCFWSLISRIAAIPCLKMSNTIVFCCQNVINCHSIHFYPKRNEVENQSKIEFPQIQF